MGRVIWAGEALPNSSEPDPVQGATWERVLRAPRTGLFRASRQIGEMVENGSVVGTVDGEAVIAAIPGLLRGLLADAVRVDEGLKLGDIDPRGRRVGVARISDKGRAVAAGVLEAVIVGLGRCSQGKVDRP
jgi:xanthine dehydrogenase accessory factor